MLLREYLNGYKKDELLNQAKILEIKKCSRLRKAEIIDKITEEFCTEEMLRSRLSCLTKEQMELFCKASVSPIDIDANAVTDAKKLSEYLVGSFEDSADKFCTFEEVADAFNKINDEAFRFNQERKGWMMKCVQFFNQYYGIAPIEVIYKLYSQQVECSIDEMVEMLLEMPLDMTGACIFTMDKLGMEEWPKGDPLYSERGILVDIQLLNDQEFECLFRQQLDKDFYIPSVQQIEEACRGCEADSQADNARMRENRGYTLKELEAKRLANAPAPVVKKSVVRTGKKIYPNDPCPCGSGKKYKKCCGRNK